VFASRLVSPGEYHYLFGPSTDEVLDDGCPTEWVGTRIVTGLNTEGRIRVVPDRLTYLAGARTRPSEVLAANWSRGDEWRDWFVTGIGVTRLPAQPSEGLEARLEEHLLSLHTIEQQEIYTDLLTPRRRSRFQADTLYELLENLDAQKALLRTQLNLFYPQELQTVTDLRASMAGTVALLDTNQVRRFRSDRLPVKNMQQAGVRRLEAFQSAWKRQPENLRRSGSASISMVQALLRLDQLYAEFFRPGVTLPSPPVELVPPMSPVPPVD
jgi:integrase